MRTAPKPSRCCFRIRNSSGGSNSITCPEHRDSSQKVCQDPPLRLPESTGQAGKARNDTCRTGPGTPETEGQNTLSDQDAGKTREGCLQMPLLQNRQDVRHLRYQGQGKPKTQALPVQSRTNVKTERVRDYFGLIRDMMEKIPQSYLWVGEPMPVGVQIQYTNPNRPAKSPM